MIAMLLKEMCGIKRKNAVLIFFIIIVFLCQVHFVVKSQKILLETGFFFSTFSLKKLYIYPWC